MDTLTLTASFFVLLTGLCFGSFLNVVVLRAFSGESISYPASKCPKCQKPLYWWHNIPLLSYLILGGKCFFCKEHISRQYPLVEAVTGILFVLAFLKFGMSAHLIFVWAVIFMSLVLAVTDIKENVVFLLHCLIFALIGLVYYAGATGIMFLKGEELSWLHNPLTTSILGLLLGGLIMFVYFIVTFILAGGKMATGDGDIYITMALGACFGWEKIVLIIIAGFLIQALISLVLFEYNLIKEKNYRLFSEIFILLLLVAGYLLSNNAGLFAQNYIYLLAYTIILIVLAVQVCRQLLGKVLGGTTSVLRIPFGPALVLAGLIMLFFPFSI